MEKLIHFFLKRKLIVYLCTFLIILGGIGSLLSFKVSFVPKTNMPYIFVNISGGSLPAEEMEEKITNKIEKELKSVSDIVEYPSSTMSGNVRFNIKAKPGTGAEVKQKIESIVNRLRNGFPKEVDNVVIEQASYGDDQLAELALTGASPEVMLNLAETTIKDRLESADGVKTVQVNKGGFKNEVSIQLKPERLLAYGLTPQNVMDQLRQANWKQAIGTLENNGYDTVIEIDHSFASIQEIESVSIATPHGSIPLNQLAVVEDLRGKVGDSIELYKGKPYVHLVVTRSSESDVITTQKNLDAIIADINAQANGTYKIVTLFEVASFVETSINNLSHEVMIGGALAIIILYLFLRNLRVTMVIAATLPLSALMTFIAMKIFGYDIDAVSLISLSLSVGLIVDAAIVVLESIYHFREKGEPLTTAIVHGTKEVLTPVLSSQLTMIVVFLPLVLADFGEEFRPIFTTIAFTVTAAITASTIAAIFFVPILADNFLKNDKAVGSGNKANSVSARMLGLFQRLLGAALRNRIKTIVIALLLFVGCFFLTPFIKQGQFMDVNENFLFARLVLPKGTSLEAARETALQAEKSMSDLNEMKDLFVEVNKNNVMLYISLKGKAERDRGKDELSLDVNARLKAVEGVERLETNFGGSGGAAAIELKVIGKELETASKVTADVEQMLSTIPGVQNTRNDFKDGYEKLTLIPKKETMEKLQVDQRELLSQMSGFIGKQTITKMTVDGIEFDITATYPEEWMKHPDQLKQVLISTQSGSQVPLFDLVDWKYSKSPTVLNHEKSERVITVSAEMAGTDLGTVGREVDEKLPKLSIPEGYKVELAGDLKQQNQNMTSGIIVFLGAIALIYVIMVGQFGRLSHPFIIMLTLP
ncbi:MAG: efflux RND transporter permease subunit, partial [Clostridia bacterium]